MSDHAAMLIARQFRTILKSLDDLSRRSASSVMSGRVAEIDGSRVRLELRADSPSGKPFLSPWVQLQDAAGATASHMPVAVGDPMRLLSPNGEIGAASLAIRDSHTNAAANPSEDPQTFTITHAGCALVMREGAIELHQGGAVIRLAGGAAEVQAAGLTHNGVNVGQNHIHSGVLAGGETSGPPTG